MKMTAWDKVESKAREHHGMYPTFDLNGYLAFVKDRGIGFTRWAASQTTAKVNKLRHKDRSLDRLAEKD